MEKRMLSTENVGDFATLLISRQKQGLGRATGATGGQEQPITFLDPSPRSFKLADAVRG
jgi:hypothetical protein